MSAPFRVGDRIEFAHNGVPGVVQSVTVNATDGGHPVIVWRELVHHSDGGSHLGAECVHSASLLRLAP